MVSELAGPERAEIFQKYPSHQPCCRCVTVAQPGGPSAAVFPWKLPATPLPRRAASPPQPGATEELAGDVTAAGWEGIPGPASLGWSQSWSALEAETWGFLP